LRSPGRPVVDGSQHTAGAHLPLVRGGVWVCAERRDRRARLERGGGTGGSGSEHGGAAEAGGGGARRRPGCGGEEAALAAHRAQQPVAPSVGARQARRRGIAQRGIGAARQERTSDMIACQPVTGLPGTREARLAHLGERTVRTGGAGGGKGGDEADLPPGAV